MLHRVAGAGHVLDFYDVSYRAIYFGLFNTRCNSVSHLGPKRCDDSPAFRVRPTPCSFSRMSILSRI